MPIVLNGTEGINAPSVNAGNIVGQVCFFGMTTAPAGFLKANGAAVSRTTYADLFTAIGTTYGAGNGSTTFNLPDLRGEFPRGWDDGRGVDSGRVFGSAQADQMQSHTHTVRTDNSTYYSTGSGAAFSTAAGSAALNVTSATGGTTNSSENRPRNVALLACIKF